MVFNDECDWVAQGNACYGAMVAYRSGGASAASRVGAVAALVRSAAAFSINRYTTHHYHTPVHSRG